jgi:isopenicillin-N N-acyltransferase-like protein
MRLHRYTSGEHRPDIRGRDLGAHWAGAIGAAVTAYQEHFQRLGLSESTVNRIADASLDAVDDWCPPLAVEIAAIASGADRPVRDLAMLNARTEVLALAPPDEGECSTAVRVPAPGDPTGRLVAFQTWDWHPGLARDGLLWRYEPVPGRWVKTFTEFGMLAKIGVSSAGLAVHFNILRHASDTASGGVPMHVIARRILDEASTVDEAYDLVRSARVGASTVLTVVASGASRPEAASIEIAPDGAARVLPRADGWLTHTNHFLSPDLSSGDRPRPTSTTKDRLAHLDQVVSEDLESDDLSSLARAMCGPSGEQAPIGLTDQTAAVGSRSRTLLTVRLDPLSGRLDCWPGTPYQAAESGDVFSF